MSRRLLTGARSRALALFNRFHGQPVKIESVTTFSVPEHLIKLGQAIAIVYKCDKKNGGGDGQPAEYVHDFETPVGLYMDETGKKQLYLIGSKLKVTTAGIEN